MSFLLSLSTQSHAFTSEPTIHLRTGVRRWAHREPKLSFDSGHYVFSYTIYSINPNQVAAFPSLHAGYPFLAFLFTRRAFGRAG